MSAPFPLPPANPPNRDVKEGRLPYHLVNDARDRYAAIGLGVLIVLAAGFGVWLAR